MAVIDKLVGLASHGMFLKVRMDSNFAELQCIKPGRFKSDLEGKQANYSIAIKH